MLSGDGVGPAHEAAISVLTANALAFTCLPSSLARDARGLQQQNRGLGDPPAPLLCSMANPVQQGAFT